MDFGSASVNAGMPVSQSVAFTFAGLSAQPIFKLSYGIDFQQGSISCTPGWTSCQVNITFSPQYPGNRQDGLIAMDSQGNVVATAYLYGQGTGPQVAFSPGTIKLLPMSPASNTYSLGGVVVDPTGAIYFSDTTRFLVEKLTPGATAPVIVAGLPGVPFASGDGGPATNAGVGTIFNLALDPAGNLFLADQQTVRKVDASTGLVTTVAGGGFTYSGDGGPATSVGFPQITGIALDRNGNLYISERYDIRKVNAITGIITTAVASGTPNFSGARAIAIDSLGNLYLSSVCQVQKIDAETVTVTTIAGSALCGYYGDGGPATQAQLTYPVGLNFDAQGDLYVADSGTGSIRKIDAISHTISTVAGRGVGIVPIDGSSSDSVELDSVDAIASDSLGNIFLMGWDLPLIEIEFSAPSLLFPWPGTFETAPVRTFAFSNIGNETLNMTSQSISGPFQLQTGIASECNYSSSVAPGASCNVSVAYSLGQGTAPGLYTVQDNALNQTAAQQRVSLAIAYPQSIVSPTIVSFGPAAVGGFDDQFLTISNTAGKVPLEINSVTFGGANPGDFSLFPQPCSSVQPQSSCQLQVIFNPKASGSRTATLIITSNAADSPETLNLVGTGIPAGYLTSNPPSVDFGKQRIGAAGREIGLNLGNAGGSSISVEYAVVNGSPNFFSTGYTCALYLNPGASCTMSLAFKPSTAGSFSGSIQVWYSRSFGGPSESLSIALQGQGVSAAPTTFDLDGDGKTDYAIWRPGSGTWFVIPSANVSDPVSKQWGLDGDIPAIGDFDGDGKSDYAVWRPSNGTWYVIPSSDPTTALIRQWGLPGDIPVTGDFDGDGKSDYAVWRTSNGTWYIIPSSDPTTALVRQWGLPGDVPLIGDFDGDGKTDYAVWRPSNGTWYIIPSSDPGAPWVQQWGLPGDLPVSGDFDGDGKADYAVWRSSSGTWFVIPSSTPGIPLQQQWGLYGDRALP